MSVNLINLGWKLKRKKVKYLFLIVIKLGWMTDNVLSLTPFFGFIYSKAKNIILLDRD